jgi:hypothetical protein
MNKIGSVIFSFILLLSCGYERPYLASQEYCKCMQKNLTIGIDTLKTIVMCDSQLATQYTELKKYYVEKKDTHNFNDIRLFYYEYSRLKSKKCP